MTSLPSVPTIVAFRPWHFAPPAPGDDATTVRLTTPTATAHVAAIPILARRPTIQRIPYLLVGPSTPRPSVTPLSAGCGTSASMMWIPRSPTNAVSDLVLED